MSKVVSLQNNFKNQTRQGSKNLIIKLTNDSVKKYICGHRIGYNPSILEACLLIVEVQDLDVLLHGLFVLTSMLMGTNVQ